MSTAPEGYKPVIHRQCGTTIAWVKSHVLPTTVVRSSDILNLDGESVSTFDRMPSCKICGLVSISGLKI